MGQKLSTLGKTSRVACVALGSYDPGPARDAVERAAGLLGGMDRLVPARSRVLVKINHLSPATAPESAVITHPAVAEAMARALLDRGCRVAVGDDVSAFAGRDEFAASGYRAVFERLGVRMLNLKEDGFRPVDTRGEVLTSTHLSAAALDADVVVNIPKLKTHAFTGLTCAVKNLYGLVPHGLRLQYHRRFRNPPDFARMLLDVLSAFPRIVHVVDGVEAMEGNGPAGGTPRRVGVLLAGTDAVAVDAAAGRLTGFGPGDVLTTAIGAERGEGAGRWEDVDVVGDPLDALRPAGFKRPALAMGLARRWLPSRLYAFVQSRIGQVPRIDGRACSACGECARICPTGAARMVRPAATPDRASAVPAIVIARALCIKCLCCHEVCRSGAVRLRETAMGFAVDRTARVVRRLASAAGRGR